MFLGVDDDDVRRVEGTCVEAAQQPLPQATGDAAVPGGVAGSHEMVEHDRHVAGTTAGPAARRSARGSRPRPRPAGKGRRRARRRRDRVAPAGWRAESASRGSRQGWRSIETRAAVLEPERHVALVERSWRSGRRRSPRRARRAARLRGDGSRRRRCRRTGRAWPAHSTGLSKGNRLSPKPVTSIKGPTIYRIRITPPVHNLLSHWPRRVAHGKVCLSRCARCACLRSTLVAVRRRWARRRRPRRRDSG